MSGVFCYRGPHPPQAVPLPLIGEGISRSAWGTGLSISRQRFARRKSEVLRRTFAGTPTFRRVITFPYEGKGDRVSGG